MGSSDQATFQPIDNPYIVGNPIDDRKMFFGREDDFAYIRNKVSGAQKGGLLVLCGARRSGKTSILFQVMSGRLGAEFIPVLLDMQVMAVESDRDFLIKIAQEIADAIGDSSISMERDFLGQPDENASAKFEKFIIKVNATLSAKKLVLLFDEYEIIETLIEKNQISTTVLNLLGNWIEHKGGAFVVFTGSDRLDERTASYWSGFLTRALYRGVSYLSKNDTMRLIREPVEPTVRWEDGVPEQIWTLTAGQAFYTQVYCQALVDRLNERREYDVRARDVQEVTDEILENPLPQMIFSWNSMLPMEKVALSIIGEISRDEVIPVSAEHIVTFAKSKKIGYDVDLSKLNEALEKLFHHDLLDKDETLSYTFKMDLWRRWIARMRSIWQVADEFAASDDELGEGLTKSRSRRARLGVVVPVVVVLLVAAFVLISQRTGRSDRQPLAVLVDSTVVTIVTEPPGAWVFLNERRIDRSPIENLMVAAVPTFVRIEQDGYKAFVDSLYLKKDVPLDTSLTLVQRIGNVEVSSSPTGADIYLDGENTGLQTPRTLQKLAVLGFHRVGLRLASYAAHEWPNVSILEDTTIVLSHAFSKLTGQVTFDTQPSGAEIVIDGAVQGKTPAVVFLNYGQHEIRFRLPGYEIAENAIAVASANQAIHETLAKLPPGKLILKILPYADVYLNGALQSSQQSRYEATLDTGQYEIELRNPHFDTRKVIVDIISNQTTERTVDVRTDKESQ